MPQDPAEAFEGLYGANGPRPVAKITDQLDGLLAFYDYPAEHWVRLHGVAPLSPRARPSDGHSHLQVGPCSWQHGSPTALASDKSRTWSAPRRSPRTVAWVLPDNPADGSRALLPEQCRHVASLVNPPGNPKASCFHGALRDN